jgi:hypothetical protein
LADMWRWGVRESGARGGMTETPKGKARPRANKIPIFGRHLLEKAPRSVEFNGRIFIPNPRLHFFVSHKRFSSSREFPSRFSLFSRSCPTRFSSHSRGNESCFSRVCVIIHPPPHPHAPP